MEKKKCTIILLSFLLSSMFVSAQLSVNTAGNVLFGNSNDVSKKISIVDECTLTGSSITPFKIRRASNNAIYLDRGSNNGIAFRNWGGVAIGQALTSNVNNSDAPLAVYSTGSPQALDIYQFLSGTEGIRLWCTGTSTVPLVLNRDGNPIFMVYGNGATYANGYYSISDASTKNNIETISGSLDKIMQLRGVSYHSLLDEDKNEEAVSFDVLKKRNDKLTDATYKQIQKEKTRKHIGVIAQEIEQVIPEAVRTREDGLKAVSYTDLIGLLIEGMKEQQVIIDDLTIQVASLLANKTSASLSSSTKTTTGIEEIYSQCILSQNTPNPFTGQTEIRYFLPEGINNASICIFDMQGKMLDTISISAGENSIIIEKGSLSAGMYLYSLIADGQIIDTKRMLLSE